MFILGVAMMVQGLLLLVGEYLCVEVAWRCMDYNQIYIALGTLLVGVGMISMVIGADDDKTDLAGMGQGPGTQSQRKQP